MAFLYSSFLDFAFAARNQIRCGTSFLILAVTACSPPSVPPPPSPREQAIHLHHHRDSHQRGTVNPNPNRTVSHC